MPLFLGMYLFPSWIENNVWNTIRIRSITNLIYLQEAVAHYYNIIQQFYANTYCSCLNCVKSETVVLCGVLINCFYCKPKSWSVNTTSGNQTVSISQWCVNEHKLFQNLPCWLNSTLLVFWNYDSKLGHQI